MITSKSGQTPDNGNFVHGCFTVQVGTDFETYVDVMRYAQQDEIYGTNANPAVDASVTQVLNSIADANGAGGALPVYFSKRKCRDTSLGGNDAINPLPQFAIDDDISHPHFQPNYGASVGMGQVYSENYDDTQQILYMGFGIPVFSNVGNFWSNAVDTKIADFTNKASGISPEKIGALLGKAPIRIIQIATIPSKFIAAMTNGLQYVPITKYYAFSSQMPMYFRFVNTILVMLATNMGIMGSSTDYPTTGSETSGTTSLELLDAGPNQSQDLSGMATVFKDYGLDMARIMVKRYLYENGNKGGSMANRNTDEALFAAANLNNGIGVASPMDVNLSTNGTANSTNDASSDGSTPPTTGDGSDGQSADGTAKFWTIGWIDAFKAAYTDTIYDGHLFIGFRIDKGMGASESFSNATGESQIAALANSKFQEGRDLSYDTMGGNFGTGTVTGVATGILSNVGKFLKGAATAFSLDPLAANLTGDAKVVIPDVWQGSSYSRSATFSISCLSPYGDMESIFQSLYVPFACVLAGALPRGTGYASHSAPFIAQAYCRGIFASPLCIMESLEVTRGADQFGFSAARLPLKLQMQVTLKDLTPTMYMSMGGDAGIAKAILGTDDNFGEYMLTMSGMGLKDRLSPFRSIRRKIEILLSTAHKNKLSPFMLGMEGGSRFMISRLISEFKTGGGERASLPGN